VRRQQTFDAGRLDGIEMDAIRADQQPDGRIPRPAGAERAEEGIFTRSRASRKKPALK